MVISPINQQRLDSDRLVDFENATVARAGGEVALRDLNWTVREGETWAVVGPVGSGKTTLAEVILGKHRLQSGTVRWPLLDRLRASGRSIAWPSDVIRHISFKEDSHLFSYGRHYYQQRFNFIEPRDDLTLDTFLRSGTSASDEAVHAAANQLRIGDLLSLSLIKLSNGQMRRARIAKGLIARPEWLILDEPFMGVDAAGREVISQLLGDLIARGTRVLLITRPDAMPDWVTHVLELDGLAARWQGPRAEWGIENLELRMENSRHSQFSILNSKFSILHSAAPLVELRNVTVEYGGRPILQDVSWTVNQGERWAVLGPNGSGKTTLLSLICGDHPQAYRNDIRLFGRPRGTGESIWEIKQRIGLVSPELHLYYSEHLTAAQTAATGFFDVLAYRPTTTEQDAVVRELFDHFGIAVLAERPFLRLSTGEQRLVLLIRALVKNPPLLILDEPFQGLDERIIRRARDWIDSRLQPDQTVIFVSHYEAEIPLTVNRRLRLDEGRVVEAS
jgi:molybdate transport system ATP-binding protein